VLPRVSHLALKTPGLDRLEYQFLRCKSRVNTHLSVIFYTIFELSTCPIVKLGHSAFPGSYCKGSHDSANRKVGGKPKKYAQNGM